MSQVHLREYQVVWTIDVHAESFEAAAEAALIIQRNPDSMATVFSVYRDDGISKTVDLNEDS